VPIAVLRDRVLTALPLILLALGAVYWGGWVYFGLVALALGLAAAEFSALMARVDSHPSRLLALGLIGLLLLDAEVPGLGLLLPGLTLFILGSLAWYLLAYERSLTQTPVSDWAMTLAIGLYLGWTGAHFLLLRQQAGGLGWSVVMLGSTALADTGAYFSGRRLGRHPMTPRLSPGKTWEGYAGGLVTGTLGALSLGQVFGFPPLVAAALGGLIALLTPLGDLGESMIKRQAGVKDAGHLLPGHGGVFDRIDSYLWAAVITVYYVRWIGR